MKLLGKYRNGNYNVSIYSDGTKVRENDLDFFDAEFPESMDIKITNSCDRGCPMCHENSRPDGLHADILNIPFINSIHPFTEMAIGGGNPLSHPELRAFLELLKAKNIIANITVNQLHFMNNLPLLTELVEQGLIYGLGVSYIDGDYESTKAFISEVKKFPNAVIHVINGLITRQQLVWLSCNNLKILILGYKDFRRGSGLLQRETELIQHNQMSLYNELRAIIDGEWFDTISFDNLALEQLGVRHIMDEKRWAEFYMGDDGINGELSSASMYVDLVEKQFAMNSCSTERFPITDNITQMFQYLKGKGGR